MSKKIYCNTTRHVIMFGQAVLLPGSNAVDEIDQGKFPQLEKFISGGEIKVMEDVAEAVAKANTKKTVEEVAAMAPNDEKVKTASGKRKNQLEELDKEAAKAETEKNLVSDAE